MHHEDHQYILLDSNVEDCVVSRQNLGDDVTQYPLKDHHREIEVLFNLVCVHGVCVCVCVCVCVLACVCMCVNVCVGCVCGSSQYY